MRKLIKPTFQIILIIIITLIVIEVVLQIMFLNLPQAIIQRMPQYPERYGIQFNTAHGAREYPADEQVDFEVNQFSGDLYQVSCLSQKDAVSIEPYQVSYTRDSHGFRNTEPWNDTVDLVVIGDSFTAAESINTPYWANLSDSMLILGLPGSGTIEQTLLLDQFGMPRSPQTVILAYFGGNDLTDNLTFHTLQQADLTFAEKTHQNRNPLEYLVSFHLALFIRDALTLSTQNDCPYPIDAQIQPATPLAFFDSMVSTLTLSESDLQNTEGYQITSQAIINIANQVQQSDAQFILMYIPQKAEVYWDYLSPDDQQAIIDTLPDSALGKVSDERVSIGDNIQAQRNLLGDLAEENNFDMLDLTTFLRDAVENGQSPYFFADTHWNQVGHDIVNKVLLDFLVQSTLDKNHDS